VILDSLAGVPVTGQALEAIKEFKEAPTPLHAVRSAVYLNCAPELQKPELGLLVRS